MKQKAKAAAAAATEGSGDISTGEGAENKDPQINDEGPGADDDAEDDAGGDATAAKKKKKKKKKGPKQTDPPSVPIARFFPDGIYPEGEWQSYNDECVLAFDEDGRLKGTA